LVNNDLWVSRYQRLKKRPINEVISFFLKTIIKTPKIILNSKDISYNLDSILLDDIDNKNVLIVTKKNVDKNFYFNSLDRKLVENYKKRFSEIIDHVIAKAEKYKKGEFSLLGNDIQFENWHKVNEVRWPSEASSKKINYYGNKRKGDIKLIWELNRMQYLPILGKAYLITKDEKYAKSILSHISSWIDQNAYLKGVNWMEGIEAAIRMYSWIFAYYFILDSKSLNPCLNNKILKSIYQHGQFIREFNSDKWIVNNNHIISELSALILIGLSFPQFKKSEKWVNFAIKKLKKEVDKQVFDDGFLWEHSTGYHKFVAELLASAVILLKKNNYQIPEIILYKLQNMFECLNYISMINGKIPLIGDEDQASVVKLGFESYDDVSDSLAIGTILFKRDDFFISKDSESVFWFFNGEKKYEKNHLEVESTFKIFKDSGYCLFKTNNSYLLYITTSQNDGYLHAGHRHLDMLSIVYEQNREYFIVDPGTYTYFADDNIRNKFRGISMHNNITIDGQNPTDLSGLFEMSPRPKAKIIEHGTYSNDFKYVWASHNGYDPITHNRIVIQIPEGFIVYDFIKGDSKNHEFVSHVHLHPDVNILRKNDRSVVLKKNNETVFIKSDKKITEEESYYSPGYGQKIKNKTLKIAANNSSYENCFYILRDVESQEKLNFDINKFRNKVVNY